MNEIATFLSAWTRAERDRDAAFLQANLTTISSALALSASSYRIRPGWPAASQRPMTVTWRPDRGALVRRVGVL